MWKKNKTWSIPAKNTIVKETTVVQSASYSWPIPHPAQMEKYELICPWSADRILTMAEKQSDHRMSLEKDYTKESFEANKRWQIFAFIIMTLWIWFWFYLIISWKELSGYIVAWSALVTTFLWKIMWFIQKEDKVQQKETRNGKEVIER